MILVDKQGVVREVFVGFDPSGEARLEAAIRRLLAEPGAAGRALPPPAAPRSSEVANRHEERSDQRSCPPCDRRAPLGASPRRI